jgi:predicted ATPase
VLGLEPGDPAEREELEALLAPARAPVGARPPRPGRRARRAVRHRDRGIRRRAAHGPVVVWIDDLQWAHHLLLDLLEVIVRSTSACRC